MNINTDNWTAIEYKAHIARLETIIHDQSLVLQGTRPADGWTKAADYRDQLLQAQAAGSTLDAKFKDLGKRHGKAVELYRRWVKGLKGRITRLKGSLAKMTIERDEWVKATRTKQELLNSGNSRIHELEACVRGLTVERDHAQGLALSRGAEVDRLKGIIAQQGDQNKVLRMQHDEFSRRIAQLVTDRDHWQQQYHRLAAQRAGQADCTQLVEVLERKLADAIASSKADSKAQSELWVKEHDMVLRRGRRIGELYNRWQSAKQAAKEAAAQVAELTRERDEALQDRNALMTGKPADSDVNKALLDCMALQVTNNHLTDECARLEQRVDRQSKRIEYLEGATNHATGTPLSKAREEITKLTAKLKEQEAKHKALVDAYAVYTNKCEALTSENIKLLAESSRLRADGLRLQAVTDELDAARRKHGEQQGQICELKGLLGWICAHVRAGWHRGAMLRAVDMVYESQPDTQQWVATAQPSGSPPPPDAGELDRSLEALTESVQKLARQMRVSR